MLSLGAGKLILRLWSVERKIFDQIILQKNIRSICSTEKNSINLFYRKILDLFVLQKNIRSICSTEKYPINLFYRKISDWNVLQKKDLINFFYRKIFDTNCSNFFPLNSDRDYVREDPEHCFNHALEMGCLWDGSAPACYGSFLGSNPDISQKIQNRQHKQRSGQHTLSRQKNIQKNQYCDQLDLIGSRVRFARMWIAACSGGYKEMSSILADQ